MGLVLKQWHDKIFFEAKRDRKLVMPTGRIYYYELPMVLAFKYMNKGMVRRTSEESSQMSMDEKGMRKMVEEYDSEMES